MGTHIPDEPRSWWLPEADPETAAQQLHDGLERLRESVNAYRERRLRMAQTSGDGLPAQDAAPPA